MHVQFKEKLLEGLGGPFPEAGPLNPQTLKITIFSENTFNFWHPLTPTS